MFLSVLFGSSGVIMVSVFHTGGSVTMTMTVGSGLMSVVTSPAPPNSSSVITASVLIRTLSVMVMMIVVTDPTRSHVITLRARNSLVGTDCAYLISEYLSFFLLGKQSL